MRIVTRVVLIVFILLLVVGLSRSRAQLFMLSNPLEGKAAPDFSLSTLTKSAVSFKEYRAGKAAILFFWATWCPHCRSALEDLDARAKEIQNQGITIVLVDVGEEKTQVKDYIEERKVALDVFLDKDSSVAGDYSIRGVPTFFLISKEGIVKSIKHALPEDYQKILTQTP